MKTTGVDMVILSKDSQRLIHTKGIFLSYKMPPASAFTLIEILVTLAVLAIIFLIAVPSFRTMLMNNRLSAHANALVNSLNYARSTALNQSMNVRVCPLASANSTACGGSWSAGWIVVTVPASGAATLLQSQQTSTHDPVLSSNTNTVTFDPHGLSTTQSQFKFCDSRGGAFARSVEVLATGFVQAGDTPGQAVWNNSALGCP